MPLVKEQLDLQTPHLKGTRLDIDGKVYNLIKALND